MDGKTFREIKDEVELEKIVNNDILSSVPEGHREGIKSRVVRIIQAWAGRDVDAASILLYASEKNKVVEYLQKLERHYTDSLQFAHPKIRRAAYIPNALRAEDFVRQCYKELGVKIA